MNADISTRCGCRIIVSTWTRYDARVSNVAYPVPRLTIEPCATHAEPVRPYCSRGAARARRRS